MPPIGDLPPWLNIQPAQFLQATEAGARAGLSIAELRQQAMARAAQMAEARARAQQQAWEFNEKMRQAAAQQAAEHQFKSEESRAMMDFRNRQLAQQGQLAGVDDLVARERFEEVMRHNKAIEEAQQERSQPGQYDIIEDPRLPGVKLLQQGRSGHVSPVERPAKELTPDRRMELQMRALGMMAPRGTELPMDPSYQSRTNQVGQMLRELDALPSPNAGTGKVLDKATAAELLREAGGDKNRARQLARERGYTF